MMPTLSEILEDGRPKPGARVDRLQVERTSPGWACGTMTLTGSLQGPIVWQAFEVRRADGARRKVLLQEAEGGPTAIEINAYSGDILRGVEGGRMAEAIRCHEARPGGRR